MNEVMEAEVVEPGTDVVTAGPTNLFHTDDPAEVAQRATKVADALQGILKAKNLTSTISGREHVRVEGWQTLGAMLGVTPVCTWTRQIEKGWEARVEARTLDGRVIGAAEAMCTRDESTWKSRDDFAIRSMAQTRATSKALGSPLRFVVTLAGYDGTPAEEMATAAPGGASLERASEADDKALRRILGNLVGDADQARNIYIAAVQGFQGQVPAAFARAVMAIAAARELTVTAEAPPAVEQVVDAAEAGA